MINIPKGLKDMLPSDSARWQFIEKVAKEVCSLYGYKEIRTPIFEYTELFQRGVGEGTDVVGKEMYTFLDKGNRSITLKPEGTAGVVRSYIENGLFNEPSPQKLYYLTPSFRYERPQAGRLREFHQFGVEVFGSASPSIDFEVISLVHTFFKKIGVTDVSLEINSIGCKQCRAEYNTALKEYYYKQDICPTCKERIERNPMRLLDCKNPACKEFAKDAPKILDYICSECKEHFNKVQEYLTKFSIPYTVNPTIVRGLDYYSRTVFEFVSSYVGAQGTVCGGGRYDGLVELMGGKQTPAIGFALGIERLIMLLEQTNNLPASNLEVFVCYVGDYQLQAMQVVEELRKIDISADTDHMQRSLKAQFKYADKIGASSVIIIGENEVSEGVVHYKNLITKHELRDTLDDVYVYILSQVL